MLIYEDLVELARMCARNKLLSWVISLKSATNPDPALKTATSRQTQITYTRAAIRTTLTVSIRISSSSKPGTKRTFRMGTLNQVPDTEGIVPRELRQKCELGTQTCGCQARSA